MRTKGKKGLVRWISGQGCFPPGLTPQFNLQSPHGRKEAIPAGCPLTLHECHGTGARPPKYDAKRKAELVAPLTPPLGSQPILDGETLSQGGIRRAWEAGARYGELSAASPGAEHLHLRSDVVEPLPHRGPSLP